MSRLVVLIPAHNEAAAIGATLTAITAQDRPADLVVVIPNGCTDNTADVARTYPVEVCELPALPHRKSEALNIAWDRYARDADVVVCLDADTILPPNALGDWEAQLEADHAIGGISSKFTMLTPAKAHQVLGAPLEPSTRWANLLVRVQAFEFACWSQTALDKGYTTVLAGTGCAIRGSVLREVAEVETSGGPWSYESVTEDFTLTYQIRKLGYRCIVSPTVRAYTDGMTTVRALWGQRIKWQVGTVQDLLRIGLNRLTLRDWLQQAACLFNVAAKALLVFFWALLLGTGSATFIWGWWLLPLLFVGLDLVRVRSVPHRDRTDSLLAGSFFAMEAFMWLRAAWVAVSWVRVIRSRHNPTSQLDLWAAQSRAEATR